VWNVIEWDISTLTAGEADYVNSEITAIRIDLVSAAGDVWEIDWVSVGSKAAPPLSAALSTEASTRATQTGELYAKYTVKVDVAGLISGYGLASTANNAAPTSSFGVRANAFFVAPPAVASATAPTTDLYDGYVWLDTSVVPNVTRYRSGAAWVLNAPVLPFVVQATPTTVNGVAVPAGVYANDLFVKNGTITNAKIANLAVDDAKIANLSVSKLTAGAVAVGQYIQSTGFAAGSNGWRINGDGTAEFANAVVRGTVYASAGSFTGSIYASSGAVGGVNISGGGLNAGGFTGYAWPASGQNGFHLGPSGLLLGNPYDGKHFHVTAAGNVFAPGLSIVDGAATFSGSLSAASGTFSGSLTADAINAVSTINIAGNAVTVPSLTEGMYGASFAPTAYWAQSMTSGYSTWPGGTFLTVIVAVTCTQTSGGDCEMMCVIVNSAGGEAQIFRSVQTMRSNDKLTVVFIGGVTIPHDDSWRVRIYMRNSWSNGTWVSDKTNILAIGAKR
jgi:hypothetical protein